MLKTFEGTLLSVTGEVITPANNNRRQNNNTTTFANRTDNNLLERITKFQELLNSNNTYKIPLRFVRDIGLVKKLIEVNSKIICNDRKKNDEVT